MTLLGGIKKADRGSIARAISMIENGEAGSKELAGEIFRKAGGSPVVGITGPAGAGKSSLINRLSAELGRLKLKPAVLAVDPTSHITGGAILGDRVRMAESTDAGTFIRSMASRGAPGAVAYALRNSIRVLDCAGFCPIIVESVGAGQTEVDISRISDITIVVFNPNTGDSIQAIKAGLTEIGDIYVINKSDLAGASRLYDAVRDYIGSGSGAPSVLRTSARRGTGIASLAKLLQKMIHDGVQDDESRAVRLRCEVREMVLRRISADASSVLESNKTFNKYLEKLLSRDMDPFEATERLARIVRRGL